MTRLAERIKESIVYDIALGGRCKTRDDLLEYIEELFCTLHVIDWAKEVSDHVEKINKSLEDHYNNTIVRCDRCDTSITLKEATSAAKEYNLNDLPNKGRTFCNQCAPSVVEQYRRVCSLCSTTYVAKKSTELYALCGTCCTDTNIEEYKRVRSQLSRARLLSLPATLTLKEWLHTLYCFQNKCAYCGDPFTCLDHYIPIGPGGTTRGNCIPACGKCNSSKSNKNPEEFIMGIDSERAKAIRNFVSKADTA